MEDVNEQDLERWNHWVVFYASEPVLDESYAMINVDNHMIYHMIGIEEYPTAEELQEYIEEVRTDPEFGLGDTVDKLAITVVPKEVGLRYLEHSS